MISSLDHCKVARHAETTDCLSVGLPAELVGSNSGRLHLGLPKRDEDSHRADHDSQRVPTVVRPARRCSPDGRAGTKEPLSNSGRRRPVERRLPAASEDKAVHAGAVGRGHSPGGGNLLRGPHFQLMSARSAEVPGEGRVGDHDLAWCVGGMNVAARLLAGVLRPPGGGDWKFGVSRQSPRGQSRAGTAAPNRRAPLRSPNIRGRDYHRPKTVRPAHPKNPPRPSVTTTNRRNREPW